MPRSGGQMAGIIMLYIIGQTLQMGMFYWSVWWIGLIAWVYTVILKLIDTKK